MSIKSWFKHFRQRWSDWCGDREMELAIRRHLSAEGYYGGTAKLSGVRLVAVQRPGWLQLYRFEAIARLATVDADAVDADETTCGDPGGGAILPAEPDYHSLYGLVRDDIRGKINIVRVFETPEERRSLFRRWSDGLICLRGAYTLTEAVSKATDSSKDAEASSLQPPH